MKRSIFKVGELIKKANKKPFSIFLLEDNQLYLQGISSHIKNNLGPNIQLKSFSKSGNFLKSLRKQPEIAVVDYHLDEQSEVEGIKLIKELKKNSPKTKIIVLTGENKIDTAIQCLSLGVTDYIVKENQAIDKVSKEIKNLMNATLLNIENRPYEITLKTIKAILISVGIAVIAAKLLLPDLFS